MSDIHLEFETLSIDTSQADVVILAGDIHVGTSAIPWIIKEIPDKPVIYVPGNHEYYGYIFPELTNELKRISKNTNIHLLENNQVEIGGITFIGSTLWTDFSLYQNPVLSKEFCCSGMLDYSRIYTDSNRFLTTETVACQFDKSKKWLTEVLAKCNSAKTVVVTHNAPSEKSVPQKYKGDPLTPGFASDLEREIQLFQPALWVHGHMHTACDYKLTDTRVVCNPRGYPFETGNGFDNYLIIEL